MDCLRCGTKMKHYKLNQSFSIYGKEHMEKGYAVTVQTPHNPHSVYECDNCGYVEFSTHECEEPDV